MLAGAILLGVFAIGVWEILREREPVYEGRKLSAWVKDGLIGDNRAWRVLMIQPGHHRSEEFVPYAIEALQTGDNRFWKPYTALRRKSPRFVSWLLPEWPEPALVRREAAVWLRDHWCGEPRQAVVVLCKVAKGTADLTLRNTTIGALCNTRAYSDEVLPIMLEELACNHDRYTREQVVLWFRRTTPDPERAIPALMRGLDSHVETRWAEAVRAYGPRAIAPLQELASGNDLSLATRARWLLQDINSKGAPRIERN
jgi:hypothetical protein